MSQREIFPDYDYEYVKVSKFNIDDCNNGNILLEITPWDKNNTYQDLLIYMKRVRDYKLIENTFADTVLILSDESENLIRAHTVPTASLYFSGNLGGLQAQGALYSIQRELFEEFIPLSKYFFPKTLLYHHSQMIARGPIFVLDSYIKALEGIAIGEFSKQSVFPAFYELKDQKTKELETYRQEEKLHLLRLGKSFFLAEKFSLDENHQTPI